MTEAASNIQMNLKIIYKFGGNAGNERIKMFYAVRVQKYGSRRCAKVL